MTPAIDILIEQKVVFQLHRYSHDTQTGAYGEEAAKKLGIAYEKVYKTLVIAGSQGQMAVAIVPVSHKLSMKKMAKALAWKKVALADKEQVSRSSGYVIGGVSPLGQKKCLRTIIDKSSVAFSTIFISAGKRGLEIELSSQDLAFLTKAKFADISGG